MSCCTGLIINEPNNSDFCTTKIEKTIYLKIKHHSDSQRQYQQQLQHQHSSTSSSNTPPLPLPLPLPLPAPHFRLSSDSVSGPGSQNTIYQWNMIPEIPELVFLSILLTRVLPYERCRASSGWFRPARTDPRSPFCCPRRITQIFSMGQYLQRW
jgi:hypothetical protein